MVMGPSFLLRVVSQCYNLMIFLALLFSMFNPTNIDMFIILFPEITQPTFRIVYLDKTRYGVGLATYHKPVDSFFVQYKPAGKFHSHLKSED